MRKNRLTIIALSVLIVFYMAARSFAALVSTADPTDIGIGARPIAIGKAFSAVSNDVNGMFMNPAGLYQLKESEMTSMHTKLMGEVSYSLFGITEPAPMGGTFGIGFIGAMAGDIIVTSLESSGRIIDLGSRMGYSNSVILVSYGSKQGVLPKVWKPLDDVSLGSTLKIFTQSFSGTNGQSAFGLDLDLGLLYKPKKFFAASVLGKNVFPSGAANLGTLVWSGGTRENIPSTLTLGTAIKLIGKDGTRQVGEQQLTAALDADCDFGGGKPTLFHAGVEWLPLRFLALRGGLTQDYTVGVGTSPLSNNLTFGVGLNVGKVGFDYAYESYRALVANSSHYFSISLRDLFSLTPDKKKRTKQQLPPVVNPTKTTAEAM